MNVLHYLGAAIGLGMVVIGAGLGIGKFAAEEPVCPVMLHFGSQDTHIPAADVEKVHSAHPEVEIFWYDAGHAFNCDPRPSYNAAAAKEARQRSLEFLKQHLA